MPAENRPRKAITLKDIANDTGYSITAVSHALHDRSDISAEAKAIITESAARLGYIGNHMAASLQSGYTRIIAVIVGDTSNPFFAFLTHALENELRTHGYSLFFMNTNEDEAIERECLLLAARQRVDGIIWCPAQQTEDNLNLLESMRIPFVIIGRYFKGHSANYVSSDDYKAGRLVAEHLIRKGHFKTIYIDTLQQNSSSSERYEGFISAYRSCGKPYQTEIVYFDTDGRYFQQLFQADGRWRADAFVAYNDLIAWDVMTRASLPSASSSALSTLSILAFDNLHSFLPLPFQLTSVSASKFSLARRSAEILLRQIDNPRIPLAHLTLDVELIDRGSVQDISGSSPAKG